MSSDYASRTVVLDERGDRNRAKSVYLQVARAKVDGRHVCDELALPLPRRLGSLSTLWIAEALGFFGVHSVQDLLNPHRNLNLGMRIKIVDYVIPIRFVPFGTAN